jgi:hypothetical protein
MTDLRTAAQQALEALTAVTTRTCAGTDGMDITPINDAFDMADTAITAIKTALEQPKPPPEAQTEAEKIAYCAGWWAALEQKREQPEQEPISQLKPNATTRLQDPGAYDRGVLTGLRQALAICSDWEDFTADRLAGDIQDAINNQMALEQPEPDVPETDCGNMEPAAWIDNTGHPKHRLYRQSATEKRLYGPLRPLYATPPTTTTQPEPK